MNDLPEAIREVVEAHRSDQDGEALVDDLIRFHRAQPPENWPALVALYRDWLESGNPIRADWAIALIRRLEIADALEMLEDVVWAIRDGRSKLPQYFLEFLEPTIEGLKRKQLP